MSGRRNARRRGSDFEYRVAKRFGGQVHTGQDGDVKARGFTFECKYRTGWKLESTTTLADWFDQIERYETKNPDDDFALAITPGGSDFWVAVRAEKFDQMTRQLESLRRVREIFDQHPAEIERILTTIQSLVVQIAEEQESQ